MKWQDLKDKIEALGVREWTEVKEILLPNVEGRIALMWENCLVEDKERPSLLKVAIVGLE